MSNWHESIDGQNLVDHEAIEDLSLENSQWTISTSISLEQKLTAEGLDMLSEWDMLHPPPVERNALEAADLEVASETRFGHNLQMEAPHTESILGTLELATPTVLSDDDLIDAPDELAHIAPRSTNRAEAVDVDVDSHRHISSSPGSLVLVCLNAAHTQDGADDALSWQTFPSHRPDIPTMPIEHNTLNVLTMYANDPGATENTNAESTKTRQNLGFINDKSAVSFDTTTPTQSPDLILSRSSHTPLLRNNRERVAFNIALQGFPPPPDALSGNIQSTQVADGSSNGSQARIWTVIDRGSNQPVQLSLPEELLKLIHSHVIGRQEDFIQYRTSVAFRVVATFPNAVSIGYSKFIRRMVAVRSMHSCQQGINRQDIYLTLPGGTLSHPSRLSLAAIGVSRRGRSFSPPRCQVSSAIKEEIERAILQVTGVAIELDPMIYGRVERFRSHPKNGHLHQVTFGFNADIVSPMPDVHSDIAYATEEDDEAFDLQDQHQSSKPIREVVSVNKTAFLAKLNAGIYKWENAWFSAKRDEFLWISRPDVRENSRRKRDSIVASGPIEYKLTDFV